GLSLVLSSALAGPALAERIIVEGLDYQVTLEQEPLCGEPARIRIAAQQPDLFNGDSAELQRIVDAVHAVLGFECRNLTELRIRGSLAGLNDVLFEGTAGYESDWIVLPKHSLVGNASLDEGIPAIPTADFEQDRETDFAVLGLQIGMTADEALEQVNKEFSKPARYDRRRRLLTAGEGACRSGRDWAQRRLRPEPGSRCLTAWFTDAEVPQVSEIWMAQVAAEGQSANAGEALANRYGEPAVLEKVRSESTTNPAARLAWGAPLDAERDTNGERELEAQVEAAGEATIVTLRLSAPAPLETTQEASAEPIFRF
ncbi:MAG: hypothetical protein OEQ39_16905, partial [Gammaproteobacteria bacterium]|nr:hypothetical protein [Gammaproteobacteria bacterium]